MPQTKLPDPSSRQWPQWLWVSHGGNTVEDYFAVLVSCQFLPFAFSSAVSHNEQPWNGFGLDCHARCHCHDLIVGKLVGLSDAGLERPACELFGGRCIPVCTRTIISPSPYAHIIVPIQHQDFLLLLLASSRFNVLLCFDFRSSRASRPNLHLSDIFIYSFSRFLIARKRLRTWR